MNEVDAILVAMLALADIWLLMSLRRRRARDRQEQRVSRSLRLSIEREIRPHEAVLRPRPLRLRRAG
jgi:hypothetical protein